MPRACFYGPEGTYGCTERPGAANATNATNAKVHVEGFLSATSGMAQPSTVNLVIKSNDEVNKSQIAIRKAQAATETANKTIQSLAWQLG